MQVIGASASDSQRHSRRGSVGSGYYSGFSTGASSTEHAGSTSKGGHSYDSDSDEMDPMPGMAERPKYWLQINIDDDSNLDVQAGGLEVTLVPEVIKGLILCDTCLSLVLALRG